MYTLTNLDDESLDAVKQLESEIGTPLIALSELTVAPAKVDDSALGKIRALEEELGTVLVAVKN